MGVATFFQDSLATLLHGDVLECLRSLPDGIAQVCVTSPPYFGLRDYGLPPQDWPEVTYCPMAGLSCVTVPAQSVCLGLEATPEAFVGHLVLVFREVRRALRADGTCFLNIGDSYARSGGAHASHHSNPGISQSAKRQQTYGKHTYHDKRPLPDGLPPGLKAKDLCMIPARLALALQADGWYLRSTITWAKKAPMPESMTDRPTNATENIYLLTKSARYYYDATAVREVSVTPEDYPRGPKLYTDGGYHHNGEGASTLGGGNPCGRNLRNFWLLGPERYAGTHYATMPTEIPRRAIKAGTSARGACPACGAPWVRVVERKAMVVRRSSWGEQAGNRTAMSGTMVSPPESVTTGWRPGCGCDAGDPVPCVALDCFLGSGTTVAVANELRRVGIGCDLNEDYLALALQRIRPPDGLRMSMMD